MRKVIFYLTFLLVISSCGIKPESKANDEVLQVRDTISPTSTPFIIATETKKEPDRPTATRSALPVPSQTSTKTPTPKFDFTGVRIFGTENRGSTFLVIFEIPGLDRSYRVLINGSEYRCEFQESVIDKLFCNGNKLRSNENVSVKFFDSEAAEETSGEVMFEAELYVAEPFKTPLPAGDPATWCPQRGQNIYCETEHRVENDEECWVSTCVDACGYYYSYHTCQFPPNNNFLTP